MLRRLLDEQWEKGAIPDDPARLAEIVGESIGVVHQAWQKLSAFFEPMPGMDGLYVRNLRLEDERTEADRMRAQRAVAGAMGGRAKANASKCQTDELALELTTAKSLPERHIDKQPVANASKRWHPAQESSSSSSSRAEQSRRELAEVPCMCGGTGGLHAVGCPVAAMLARTAHEAAS